MTVTNIIVKLIIIKTPENLLNTAELSYALSSASPRRSSNLLAPSPYLLLASFSAWFLRSLVVSSRSPNGSNPMNMAGVGRLGKVEVTTGVCISYKSISNDVGGSKLLGGLLILLASSLEAALQNNDL